MIDITWFNRNFRFVFSPKIEKQLQIFELSKNDKRFLVGAGQIKKYITEKNAETVLKEAEKMKTDKKTFKFRKYGKIDIYVK